MRDQYLELFIENFGEATSRCPVPQAALEKWRGRLPDKLLEYWQQEGWATYRHGLLRLVDPDDYADEVAMWLEDTPLAELDTFHAYAISAFGELYLCGEQCGPQLELMTPLAAFVGLVQEMVPKDEEEKELEVQLSFSNLEPRSADLEDESGELLFERAREALGDLAEDELYGFVPAVCLGGEMHLENLEKLDARVHMAILRELAEPQMPMHMGSILEGDDDED